MAADVIIDPTNGQIYWNDGTGTPQSISIKGDALNAISFVGYSGSYSPGSTPSGASTLVTVNDNSGTDALVPGTTGFSLGSASLRWNSYATNVNLNNTLSLYNGATNYTGFVSGATGITVYTLPATSPATGTSVLQSTSAGVMSWVPMAASSSSGGTVYAGTLGQLAFYGATGNTVGGATGVTYNSTTGVLYNTHTTAATFSTTGALVVSGGVGIGASIIVGGRVGIGTNLLTSTLNVSGASTIVGATVITAPDTNSKALQVLGFSSSTQGDILSFEHPAGGSFIMASNYAGQAGGRFTIVASGNAQVRSATFAINASDNKNVLIVDATSGSGIFTLNNGTQLRIYNSVGSQYSGFAFTGTSSVVYSLPATDGSSGQFLQTNGVGGLSWATATGGAGGGSSGVNAGGQYQIGYYASTGASIDGSSTFTNNTATGVVSITHGTVSTDSNTGALKVSGGVGIGGSLYVGGIGASIVGVRFSNSIITSGTWNGTAIATQYGGTGQNFSSSTGLVQISSGTASVITTSASLANIISDETGSGALVFGTTPTFSTSVVTGDSTFAVFNTNATTINAFGAATAINFGASTGKATFNSTDNSTSSTTGGLVVSGGAGIAKSLSIAGRLQLFNGSNYAAFVYTGTGNTLYTLPTTTPATGSSVLQSDSGGTLSWVPMVASSSGGAVNVAAATATTVLYLAGVNAASGSGLAVSTGTGITVSSAGLLTAVNYQGTWAGSTITAFYGGTGLQGPTAIGDIIVANSATTWSRYATSATSGQVLTSNGTGNAPTWQAVPAAAASSVATNTNNNDSTFYVTFVNTAASAGQGLTTDTDLSYNPGKNQLSLTYLTGTGFTATTALYTNTLQFNTGNNFNFNGPDGTTLATINTSNGWLRSAQTTEATNASTGSLVSLGGLGVAKNAFFGGTGSSVTAFGTIVSTGTNSGTLVVYGGAGIAGSLYTGTGYSSSISGVILANGNASASTYNKVIITAPTNTATLTLANNSSLITSGANSLTFTTTNTTSLTLPTTGTVATTSNKLSDFAATTSSELAGIISDETGTAGKLVFSTSPTFTTSVITDSATFALFNTTATTINAFGQATTMSIGAATGKATFNSTDNSTSTTTGSLVVSGGAGIAQSLSIGGRLQIFNSSLYTAFVGSQSGVNTTYTLPATSPATGSSVLQSTAAGVMSWVPMTTGGAATLPGGSSGQIQYNNGAFGGIAGFTYNSNAINDLIINTPFSFGTNGALNIGPGPFDGASSGQFNSTTNGTMLAINSGSGFTGNFITAQRFGTTGFAVSADGKITIGNNVWSLPTTAGSSGQVLTSGGNGAQATWTTVTGSGAGSGTVAIPGAQYQVAAYYSGAGASVSGSTTFTNDISTGKVSITHTTPSTSTSTGALVVSGSVGVGGSLFIGSQITQTYAPVSGAANDHALFMQSNPVPTTAGAIIQMGSATKWDGVTSGFFAGSANGTWLGINAASGNTSDFINFQENGVTVFSVGAGGTNIRLGQAVGYQGANVLASFVSTVNSYNQVIIQNKSNGTSASSNLILNNDSSNDGAFYGELGMNSSTFSGSGALNAANATYLASNSGPLVLGTTSAHPIRFTVNNGATDVMYISESGTAISVFTNFGLRGASDLRFWNAGNTFYAGIQGGNSSASYLLTMPTAPVGNGYSTIVVDSSGNMYFVPITGGLAATTATGNAPAFRYKQHHHIWFCSGYTPVAAGADSVIFRVPDSSNDGVTDITFVLKEFDVRVETPSASPSRIQVEKSSTNTGAFTLAATGSSLLAGSGLTISGAGIYVTFTNSFPAGTLVTSNDLLRLNFTLLNATHANFSVQLSLEEI